jgi:indoleamine 2,3-dioxygenase
MPRSLPQNFLGGPDEEWFRLVHIAIEATAAPAMAALAPLQAVAAEGDWAGVETGLGEVVAALRRMRGLLGRMPERCDPYIYYNRYGTRCLWAPVL